MKSVSKSIVDISVKIHDKHSSPYRLIQVESDRCLYYPVVDSPSEIDEIRYLKDSPTWIRISNVESLKVVDNSLIFSYMINRIELDLASGDCIIHFCEDASIHLKGKKIRIELLQN